MHAARRGRLPGLTGLLGNTPHCLHAAPLHPPLPPGRPPQVDYPEHVGMLHRLLCPLSPRWDITLLHFRKTGNRSATALLGLRLPEAEVADFWRAIGELSAEVRGRVGGCKTIRTPPPPPPPPHPKATSSRGCRLCSGLPPSPSLAVLLHGAERPRAQRLPHVHLVRHLVATPGCLGSSGRAGSSAACSLWHARLMPREHRQADCAIVTSQGGPIAPCTVAGPPLSLPPFPEQPPYPTLRAAPFRT